MVSFKSLSQLSDSSNCSVSTWQGLGYLSAFLQCRRIASTSLLGRISSFFRSLQRLSPSKDFLFSFPTLVTLISQGPFQTCQNILLAPPVKHRKNDLFISCHSFWSLSTRAHTVLLLSCWHGHSIFQRCSWQAWKQKKQDPRALHRTPHYMW